MLSREYDPENTARSGADIERRRLSSKGVTAFYRFGLPLIWLTGAGAIISSNVIQSIVARRLSPVSIMTVICWIGTGLWLLDRGRRFWDVWLVAGDQLEATRWRNAMRIPLSSVRVVELTHPLDWPRYVRLWLDPRPGLRGTIRFIPADARLVGGGDKLASDLRAYIASRSGDHVHVFRAVSSSVSDRHVESSDQ